MKQNQEKKRLARIGKKYRTSGFDIILDQYALKALALYFVKPVVLELGCADGQFTKLIAPYFKTVDALDASETLINFAKRRIGKNKKIHFHTSLIEDFEPLTKYNTITMVNILEHVKHPIKILQRVKTWLADNGVLIILVPNAYSIHRRLGVYLKMLRRTNEVSKLDKIKGHRRVYTPYQFLKTIRAAGLMIVKFGGNMFKPLPNDQMEESSPKLIEAFFEFGKTRPTECAVIFAVCKNKN